MTGSDNPKSFEYYEIRPCVRFENGVESYLGETEWCATIGDKVCTPANAGAAAAKAAQNDGASDVFWTVYGRDEHGYAHAIGDFNSFDAALGVLNAILAPMAAARDIITADTNAASLLDDVINQSSNETRL